MNRISIFPLLLLMLGFTGLAHASNNIEFNFQGRILSGGQPINGNAYVKFALIDTSGTTSVWSNDETSVATSPPNTSVSVSVASGIFDVMIGDTAAGMQPINGAIFNGRTDLRLRIWLSDGVHGFEQLTPDRRIPNADLLGLRKATENLTVYVDAGTGNDANSGLAANRAKRTIQAAVDMMPKFIGPVAVKIDIADGIYRETVSIDGITVDGSGSFVLQGDETTAVNATNNPAVRVTGTDNDLTHAVVRARGLTVSNCSGVKVLGIKADYCGSYGLVGGNSVCVFEKCKATNIGFHGFHLNGCSNVFFTNCWSVGNGGDGFKIAATNFVGFDNCGARTNSANGIYLEENSYSQFYTSGNFSNNSSNGIRLLNHSAAAFSVGYSGACNSNSNYGISAANQSFTTGAVLNTTTGNGASATQYVTGSAAY